MRDLFNFIKALVALPLLMYIGYIMLLFVVEIIKS